MSFLKTQKYVKKEGQKKETYSSNNNNNYNNFGKGLINKIDDYNYIKINYIKNARKACDKGCKANSDNLRITVDDSGVEQQIRQSEQRVMRDRIANEIKPKKEKILLNVLVWNVQRLNKGVQQRDRKKAKLKWIKDKLLNWKVEMVYLVDIGKEKGEIVVNGYKKVTDGRNLLLVREDIMVQWTVSRNIIFDKESKLAFAYVLPNVQDVVFGKNILWLIKQGYAIIGDMNLRTNAWLRKATTIFKGEDTLQVGVIGRSNVSTVTFDGPSDHRAVLIKMDVEMVHRMKVMMIQCEECVAKQQIVDVLEGKAIRIKPKIKILKDHARIRDEVKDLSELIDWYLVGASKNLYLRFSYMWKSFHKEPFLGKRLPVKILESCKQHLRHEEEKKYGIIKEEWLRGAIIQGSSQVRISGSKALDYEFLQLGFIGKAMNEWLENKGSKEVALMNVVRALNDNRDNLKAETFFLIKNKKLEVFQDVRMIVVMPLLMKLLEMLILDPVLDWISAYICKRNYQMGGVRGGSTFLAIDRLRKLMVDSRGPVVFIDLAKGFDTVDLKQLGTCINEIVEDEAIRKLLNIWLVAVGNLDIAVNWNQTVKRTRGLPMGLSLSPAVFVLYVDWALMDWDRSQVVGYVDDLVIAFKEDDKELIEKEFLKFKQRLYDKGLIINMEKTKLLDGAFHNFQGDLAMVQRVKKVHYLGIDLAWREDGIASEIVYNKIQGRKVMMGDKICFIVRRLLWSGALHARLRYKAMMWAVTSVEGRANIVRDIWKILGAYMGEYSYVQMMWSCDNILRIVVDRDKLIRTLDKVKTKQWKKASFREYWKKQLKIGIQQVDNIIERCRFDPLESSDQDWEMYKLQVELWWKELREEAVLYYMQEKKNQGKQYYWNIERWLRSRWNNQTGWLQMVAWGHIKGIERPKVWFGLQMVEVLKELLQKLDESVAKEVIWNLRKCVREAKVERCDRKILEANDEQWEKIIQMKLKDAWKVLDVLIEAEEIVKKKPWEFRKNSRGKVMYTDAAFVKDVNAVGIGIVLVEDGVVVKEESYCIKEEFGHRHLEGELKAVLKGLELVQGLQWQQVELNFDYLGVYYYTTNLWNRKMQYQEKYFQRMRQIMSMIKVKFRHVTSHSGDYFNERVDWLAKNALRVHYGMQIKEFVVKPQKWKNVMLSENRIKLMKIMLKHLSMILIVIDMLFYNKEMMKRKMIDVIDQLEIRVVTDRPLIAKIENACRLEEVIRLREESEQIDKHSIELDIDPRMDKI